MKWLFVVFSFLSSLLHAAEVVDIARDARFDQPVAASGMDRPEAFEYFGIYLAEEPSADKEVVLFVHGANGSPRDFVEVAKQIDPSSQQAWFAYYPTGNSLKLSGVSLAEETVTLMRATGAKKIRVVSHSMGGLVAWHLVNTLEEYYSVERLVTVATPFNGHWAAWFSRLSSDPRESWLDMSPGSELQRSIWAGKLKAPHTLVYATLSDEPDSKVGDGTISRESQLQPEMRSHAQKVVRAVASHTDVLRGDNAVRLGALL